MFNEWCEITSCFTFIPSISFGFMSQRFKYSVSTVIAVNVYGISSIFTLVKNKFQNIRRKCIFDFYLVPPLLLLLFPWYFLAMVWIYAFQDYEKNLAKDPVWVKFHMKQEKKTERRKYSIEKTAAQTKICIRPQCSLGVFILFLPIFTLHVSRWSGLSNARSAELFFRGLWGL